MKNIWLHNEWKSEFLKKWMKRKQMKTERKKQSKSIEKLNEKHKWADEGML